MHTKLIWDFGSLDNLKVLKLHAWVFGFLEYTVTSLRRYH